MGKERTKRVSFVGGKCDGNSCSQIENCRCWSTAIAMSRAGASFDLTRSNENSISMGTITNKLCIGATP